MREEILLEKTFGKPNIFKVPNGYFEKFSECIIDEISKQTIIKKQPITRFLRPVIYAACITVFVLLSTLYIYHLNGNKTEHIAEIYYNNATPNTEHSDFTLDQMYDYAMFDNDDLYSFIADE